MNNNYDRNSVSASALTCRINNSMWMIKEISTDWPSAILLMLNVITIISGCNILGKKANKQTKSSPQQKEIFSCWQ